MYSMYVNWSADGADFKDSSRLLGANRLAGAQFGTGSLSGGKRSRGLHRSQRPQRVLQRPRRVLQRLSEQREAAMPTYLIEAR